MRKHFFALLLAVLMLLTACAAPVQSAKRNADPFSEFSEKVLFRDHDVLKD